MKSREKQTAVSNVLAKNKDFYHLCPICLFNKELVKSKDFFIRAC